MVKLRKPYGTKGFSTLSLSDCLQSLFDHLQGLKKSLGDLWKTSKTLENTPGNLLFCRSVLVLKNASFVPTVAIDAEENDIFNVRWLATQ